MTFRSDPSALADLIDALDACLPQTQCTRCGYPCCQAYAQALARGEADLNQCPPGGAPTIAALAAVLGVAPKPLNRAHGEPSARVLASIDERLCIGCRKCIEVCPVDAILGAPKQMHTVIARECNGCALCVPVCPVDCIALLPAPPREATDSRWPDYSVAETARWRRRTQARADRLSAGKRPANARGAGLLPPPRVRRAEIQAALARVRLKKSAR